MCVVSVAFVVPPAPLMLTDWVSGIEPDGLPETFPTEE